MLSGYDKARLGAQACDVGYLRRLLHATSPDVLRAEEDSEEFTSLHFAALMGCQETVRFLLEEAGADARRVGADSFSPLHAAAMNGHSEVCRLLLERGADPDVQTDVGYAPMHSAAWAGHAGVIELLLEQGARTDLQNYRGETPLHTARRQAHPEATILLGDLRVVDTSGQSTEGDPREAETEEEGLQPPNLVELAEITDGICVAHEPAAVTAQRGGRSSYQYTWEHRTTLVTYKERIVVEQFGAFGSTGSEWIFWTITGEPFTPAMFEDWYACPGSVLEPGVTVVDEANWTGMDEPQEELSLWYYIGRDPSGRRVKGKAIVELLSDGPT